MEVFKSIECCLCGVFKVVFRDGTGFRMDRAALSQVGNGK